MEYVWNDTNRGKIKYSGGGGTDPLPPQIPHGLTCGEYSLISVSSAGGTCCVLLHKLLEEVTASSAGKYFNEFVSITCHSHNV
jgi:hypothetical protein